MKQLTITSFVFIFLFSCVMCVAAKDKKEIPPWMENAVEEFKGRGVYLVPKGAKRKMIGAQVIVEPPNEYVARRLYEMEHYLEKRLGVIEKKQDNLHARLEELRKIIEDVKGIVTKLRNAKRDISRSERLEGGYQQ